MKDGYPTIFFPKGEVLRREERKAFVEARKTADAVAFLAERGWVLFKPGEDNFIKKVKSLRDAQNMHEKTLNYGWLQKAKCLGKEVDEILKKLLI